MTECVAHRIPVCDTRELEHMDSGSLTECVAFLLPCVPAAHPIWGASEYVRVGARTSTRQLLAIECSGYMESRYEIMEYHQFVFEFVIVKGKSSAEQNAFAFTFVKSLLPPVFITGTI